MYNFLIIIIHINYICIISFIYKHFNIYIIYNNYIYLLFYNKRIYIISFIYIYINTLIYIYTEICNGTNSQGMFFTFGTIILSLRVQDRPGGEKSYNASDRGEQ